MKKYITSMTLLAIVEISLALYLTEWRNIFWTAVEHKDFHGFCIQIGVFTFVAVLFCFVSAYAGYFTTMCAIKWREKLNFRCIHILNKREMAVNYGIVPPIENFNQRIEADCREYPDLMLNISFGLGKAILYVIVFSISLIFNFNIWYLVIISLYAIISTVFARKIATPLIQLNYKTQQAEATYRNDLSAINFSKCIDIMFGLAIKTKRLSYFQTFYGQIAVVLPIIIVAPAYFGSALTLGALMQATGTMGTITDNLSFGITSFNQINKLLSCRKRLYEIGLFDK